MRSEVIKELDVIRKKHGDDLSPQKLVEIAKSNPKSALYAEFGRRTSWDVNEAAMQQWIHTARQIIDGYKLVIVHKDIKIEVPAMVSNPSKTSSYRDIGLVNEEEQGNQVLLALCKDIKGRLQACHDKSIYFGFDPELLTEAMVRVEQFTQGLDQVVPKTRRKRRAA